MIVIRHVGYSDVKPALHCGICHQRLSLHDAWLAFPALTEGVRESPGVWCHRRCSDGEAQRLFKGPKLLLWKATDLLSRIMRETEE